MLRLYTKLFKSVKDENGQDMVEYAIMTGMIAVAAIVAIQAIATWVVGAFTALQGALAA